ncbi:MAG: DUF3244 domain-containing protein [Bacteroidales bacterium]|nr:DUF3244 domain-containing protein [Bacteroidales bacterium]
MKYRNLTFIILTAIFLMVVSCKKFNPFENSKPTLEYVSGNEKDKIDLKGSLLKPDMRYVNIYAELVGKIVYVYFNEPVEPCLMTLSAENEDVLYARNVQKQAPATLRIYMENEPTGDYRLYITNGTEEASAWFHFENEASPNRVPVPIEPEFVRLNLQFDRSETGIK